MAKSIGVRIGRIALWTGCVVLGLIAILILLLVLLPLNLIKEPIEDTVAAATGRSLHIGGDIDIDWGLRPKLQVGALQFGNADWSETPVMAEVQRISASIDIPALFTGELRIPELSLTAPRLLLERNSDGEANWKLREDETNEPPSLPNIGRLRIEDGRLHYREMDASTDLQVSVESGGPDAEDAALRVNGEGTLHGEPFALDARGDSLLALYDTQRPYRLRVELEAEETRIEADGNIDDLLQLEGVDMRLELAGPDPARLNRLLAIALPNLPPYQVQGRLQHRGDLWHFRDFEGTVGDSDLHGSLTVDTAGELSKVSAELHSEVLDFADLGSLVGGEPSPDDIPASRLHTRAEGEDADGRLLPDARLDVKKLQNFNADVRYRATRVDSGKLPVDELILDFKLQDGELALTPLRFRIGNGSVDLEIRTKMREQPMTTQLSAEIRNVDLRRVLAAVEIAEESAGTVAGHAKLWMTGDSIAAMLGSADGGMYLLMSGGHLDKLLVELAGLDAAESVADLLGRDKKYPIECAYADLQSKDGLVQIPTLVVDTTDTLFFADGSINLKDETLNVELRPEPKDWSPISLRGPLHIEGTLTNIQLRPGASVLVRGVATVLSAAAAPLSALLPLLDTGSADDEGSPLCGGLMENMQRQTEKEQREQ